MNVASCHGVTQKVHVHFQLTRNLGISLFGPLCDGPRWAFAFEATAWFKIHPKIDENVVPHIDSVSEILLYRFVAPT